MTDPRHLALIHAEIDGELDGRQRSELAQRLLSDPEARALREELRRLCTALDSMQDVEPPDQLRTTILAALPPATPSAMRSGWSAGHWRYAALLAGVIVAGAVVFETVQGPEPAVTEVAGTIGAARAPTTLDTVQLGGEPVTGQVSLYRDAAGLGVTFEISAPAPVDILIADGDHTLRVTDLGHGAQQRPATRVALPGFGVDKQSVTVTFLMAGRPVSSIVLREPEDP